ncbi:MAG TPA: hypothetical protein VM577_15225, partial [Anaerovoracaceae bacterium]|nr:hypothetical protein [Anaerovoracaceae bacterium]
MKKQMFSVLAGCLSFAILFASCGNTTLPDDTEKTILDNNYEVGMLLYSGEEVPYDAPLEVLLQSKTDVFQGVWNIQSGSVEISGTPRVTALGPEYASVIDLWDGKDSFLIRSDEGIEKNEPSVEFIPYDYQAESRLVHGDGYSAEITTGNVCILTVEDGTETDFGNIDKAIEHN